MKPHQKLSKPSTSVDHSPENPSSRLVMDKSGRIPQKQMVIPGVCVLLMLFMGLVYFYVTPKYVHVWRSDTGFSPNYIKITSGSTVEFVNQSHSDMWPASDFHPFHIRRVLQLTSDAFISVGQILQFGFLRYAAYLVLPVFGIVYFRRHPERQSLLMFYLIGLWIVVPWIVLATYSGELTDYYFSLPRDIAIAALAYLTVSLHRQRNILLKALPVIIWSLYALNNVRAFLAYPGDNLPRIERDVRRAVSEGTYIPFKDKDPESYVYYVYSRGKDRSTVR